MKSIQSKSIRYSACMLAALLTVSAAQAQVTVKNAWVRATGAQQKATGAFMQIQAEQDSKLVSASSPLTPIVEVHEMVVQNDIMKMREIAALELPAGKAVELRPGSYHVMLMDLKQPVKEGETVPLTLLIERKDGKRETVQVQAPVRALTTKAPSMDQGASQQHNQH